MHDIELALGEVVLEHVMDPHLEVGMRQLVQHRGVPIGRDDDPLGGHAVGQPQGDRAASGAHLQAAPPAADAARLELGDRSRVEQRLEGPQPLALPSQGVVVRVDLLLSQRHPEVVQRRG